MSGEPNLWRKLENELRGSFSAHARGFFGAEFALSRRDGTRFGRLRIHAMEGAELEAGNLLVSIERTGGSGYRLLAGGEEVLSAETPSGELRIRRGEHPHGASVSPLRNTATARSPEGKEVARVSGGLLNRRYEVVFDGEGSLPVAVFLLFYVAALRRRVYRTGIKARSR